MRKLREQSMFNSPEEYDRIFRERRSQSHQEMDVVRWKSLYKPFKGGKLCDLGCLDSLVPHWAKRDYPESDVWGLDQSTETIEEMQKIFPDVRYEVGDVYNTMFEDGYFDYVVAGELIEHLERPEDFIKEAFRILKSGGKLALSTPKEETEDGDVDQHRHLWSFSAQDIRDLSKPYMRGAKIKELPSWIKRRISYHHPYLICHITKK